MLTQSLLTLAENGLMDWLMGLSRIDWSDPRAAVDWRYPLAAWVWVLIALGALALAGWSYSRLVGPRWARFLLAAARLGLILFIVALLAGPMLVLPRERVEPDVLIMLVDRSASMTIRDVRGLAAPPPAGEGAGQVILAGDEPISRDQAMRRALALYPELFDEQELGKNRQILWLGFDDDTFDLPEPLSEQDQARAGQLAAAGLPAGPRRVVWEEPEGQATALRSAIEQALRRVAGQPVAGIVLFTDGRSPEATGADLVRRLNQQAVGIYPVPLGAEKTPLDVAVAQVEAPEKAFVNDTVPVNVYLERYPYDVELDPGRIHVRLVDTATGEVLDETTANDPNLAQPVRLRTESAMIGPVKWRVEVDVAPEPGQSDEELITENNRREVALELIDRPIRVLYVEGYPRWDYRYLKSMLVREDSIESSILLISADPSFAQEGDVPITRLPRGMEELDPYDVIIIGDVPANYFSSQQLSLLRDHVSDRGAGMLWIAGERYTPRAYDTTELAALLPMRRPARVTRMNPSVGPVAVRPTPLADALSVLQLHEDSESAQGDYWPDDMPGLLWVQDLGELKPTAEPLALGYAPGSAPAPGSTPGGASSPGNALGPLVTRMRYGAGEVIYVGTDDAWRWRYGTGELHFEQFYVQLVRMLGRNRIQQDASRVRLSVSRRRVSVDQPVVVTLTIEDALLLKRHLPRVSVAVTRHEPGADGGPGRTVEVERLELLPVSPPDAPTQGQDAGEEQSQREYQAIWRPITPGQLNLEVVEAALVDQEITQSVEVVRPDDELRQPAPDHPRLVALAEQTGGEVVPLTSLQDLRTLVPNRARRTPDDLREPLWNSYLALFLALGLLTAEWIGRKLIRLV